eukprot:CAMPEP_0171649190 /NCGR_PEP_ID=MMETSP0990-20121206/36622_1 /TAXON_ID=483369 /ORGANISM="non described non described, Strain CCMP2098" /LENGTH=62 /DNA_ID=CAMNT_0012226993 /DNA_START=302 /DNA_END=490 /DNA_ORIENTATION=+
MPPKMTAGGGGKVKIPDKLTDSEKKKQKQANKVAQNPEKAAAKKTKNDAKRASRVGTTKTFS